MAEIRITKENFDKEVLSSDIPVLLDFWANWCGPCMMLGPIVEDIANEYKNVIKVGKVNVDDEPELANAFQVTSIPMIVIFEKGIVKNVSIGYRPKEDVINLFDN